MDLIVDIGNSNVVLGFSEQGKWRDNWRLPTNKDQDAVYFYDVELRTRLLESNIEPADVNVTILSSVVPSLRDMFATLLQNIFSTQVVIVGPILYEQLGFDVPRPYEIGTDLVANAYSAYRGITKPSIVIDFGTALTFTTVNEDGKVLGVAIAPGIKTAMKALSTNTAQLPEIPLSLPVSVLGQNTTHAMQAGILWGYVGMVKELIQKIRGEVGEEYVAVATGGLSFVMKPLKQIFYIIDIDLTINGLRYMLNDWKKLQQ